MVGGNIWRVPLIIHHFLQIWGICLKSRKFASLILGSDEFCHTFVLGSENENNYNKIKSKTSALQFLWQLHLSYQLSEPSECDSRNLELQISFAVLTELSLCNQPNVNLLQTFPCKFYVSFILNNYQRRAPHLLDSIFVFTNRYAIHKL